MFRLLSVLRDVLQPPRSSEKKRLSEASASGQAKLLLPVSGDRDAVSPKSKVLKAYGMSTSRSLQPHESDGVLSIQQIFSSPGLEISSAEDTAPAEDPASKEVPFKEYDSSKGRQVRAYEDGKLEEISSPVHHRVKGKQPQKSSICKKPASKKKAEKKATPSLGPEEVEKIQKIIQENKATLVLHRLRMASASKPERSYVAGCFCSDNQHKQSLLVEFSQKAFPDAHKDLAKKALKKIVDCR